MTTQTAGRLAPLDATRKALMACDNPAFMTVADAVQVLAAFERHRVEYVLVGSMAMAAQGIVRATRDMDVFVSAEEPNVSRLKAALREVFCDPSVDADLESEAVRFEGLTVRVATPRMLYRMKKSTVRPQDRLDAQVLKDRFELEDD